MKVSDLFVRCLENEGVRYIFGVPGEENEDLLFSLEDSPIRFIPCRHEQGAAFMANVWGRLTGRAGVCLATLGPGATNLLTGVADANLDNIRVNPVISPGIIDDQGLAMGDGPARHTFIKSESDFVDLFGRQIMTDSDPIKLSCLIQDK